MMRRYLRLISYPLSQWPKLILILALTALTSGVAALQPWPMKILVDYALNSMAVPALLNSVLSSLTLSPTPIALVMAAAIFSLGLFVVNSALSVGLTWTWAAAGQRMTYDLAADLFHRLQRLSLLFHSRHPVGDSLSRLTGDAYCVYTMTGSLLVSPVQHVLTLATIGVIAWKLDPALTVVALCTAPVMGGAAIFFGPRLKRRAKQSREIQSRLMSLVHQTLTAIPIVQAFSTEDRNRQQFQELAQDAVAVSQRARLVRDTYGLVNSLATTIGIAVVLYAGGRRVLSGALSVGSLLVFMAYMRSILGASRGLLNIYGSLKSTEASVDRVLEVLDIDEEVKDAPNAVPLPARPTGGSGHVRLENVTFGYEPDRPVLQDVTLEARPGETVALVGPTGVGKSTLASLIPRFYDPWEGRVLFDGMDLRQIKLKDLRNQISFVLQEPFLLPLSVAENIAYSRPEAGREEIIAAAVAAGADEFIRQLPQGYDSVIDERGADLSGGQKQRLAIARALLKDAPVLILDEPTSALDAQTEADLLEALERLMEGRTTFIIAHRLSTIRHADQIAVLEQGKIVETGTHEDLLGAGGLYHHFHALQFSGSAREVAP